MEVDGEAADAGGPQRQQRVAVSQDLSDVRLNLRNHGKGIVSIPAPYRRHNAATVLSNNESPELPPKYVADSLMTTHFECVHPYLPVNHWPSFLSKYEDVYASGGSLAGISRDWAASLFGVFACGSLYLQKPNHVQEGKGYIKTCLLLLDIFKDGVSMDQVGASLLVSIFLHEVGSRVGSWVWMGSSARLGQELRLHDGSGVSPSAKLEKRRCLWWSIYCWDRLVYALLLLLLLLS